MAQPIEQPEYTVFSREEMEHRYEQARSFMARQGFDALMVSGEENFLYFAGASASLAGHTSVTRPSIFLLPMDRDPIIVTQGRDNLVLGSYVTDIRDYTQILSFPRETLLEAVAEISHPGSRIGVELGHEQRMGIPVGSYLDLVATLDDRQFEDAGEILIQLRMVKSAGEIDLMREAADVTGRARQRLFDVVSAGMTERQVARLLRQLMLEEGADGTSFVIFQMDQPGAGNVFHYDRLLPEGAALSIDAGAYIGMYTIDYPRLASIGPATDGLKRLHQKVLEINGKMIRALEPGVSCAHLHQVGMAAIRESGLDAAQPPALFASRMGHGQGLLITEPPSISPDDKKLLEPGMVISTEPSLWTDDGRMIWEDVHVITESGSEQLTSETPELREITSA